MASASRFRFLPRDSVGPDAVRATYDVDVEASAALQFDGTAALSRHPAGSQPGGLAHLQCADQAVRLQAAGHVDRVTPQVVAELRRPDHPGDHRPGVDPDPHVERTADVAGDRRHGIEHVEAHGHHALRMVGGHVGYAADHHVGIADRLDLLEAVAFR